MAKKLYETVNTGNWIKGRMGVGQEHCLLGHLLFGPHGHESLLVLNEDIRAVYSAIYFLYPDRVNDPDGSKGSMTTFNDHPETTIDDILRVLKVADV